MRVFLKAYTYQQRGKKRKKRKKKEGGGRFRVRTPEIGPRENRALGLRLVRPGPKWWVTGGERERERERESFIRKQCP